MGKIVKKVVSAITNPIKDITGINAQEEAARKQAEQQQAQAEAEKQRQLAEQAQTPASTETATAETSGDTTETTAKKKLAKGRKSLTVARTGGAGLNV